MTLLTLFAIFVNFKHVLKAFSTVSIVEFEHENVWWLHCRSTTGNFIGEGKFLGIRALRQTFHQQHINSFITEVPII